MDSPERTAGQAMMRKVKAHFALQGTTYSEWAVAHGWSKQMVAYVILHPAKRGVLAAQIRHTLYAETHLAVKGETNGGVA